MTEYEWGVQQAAQYFGRNCIALLQDLDRLREHLEKLRLASTGASPASTDN